MATPRKCLFCDRVLDSDEPSRKYCSRKCSNRAFLARDKERSRYQSDTTDVKDSALKRLEELKENQGGRLPGVGEVWAQSLIMMATELDARPEQQMLWKRYIDLFRELEELCHIPENDDTDGVDHLAEMIETAKKGGDG